MSLFSTNFSFSTPSSRPEHLYPSECTADSISPTSSRACSPASPTTTAPSSVDSSTDDLFALTNTLSSSSLYPAPRHSFCPHNIYHPGRRSPPRSTPFSLPPSSQPTSAANVDLLARRERRQAYVQDQLSTQSRRKLSLLVARMLGDDVSGVRRHPSDGLHPSNVRVVPAMPGIGSAKGSRRNTLAEVRREGSSDEDVEGDDVDMSGSGEELAESIENGESAVSRREAANRISKRRSAEKGRRGGKAKK